SEMTEDMKDTNRRDSVDVLKDSIFMNKDLPISTEITAKSVPSNNNIAVTSILKPQPVDIRKEIIVENLLVVPLIPVIDEAPQELHTEMTYAVGSDDAVVPQTIPSSDISETVTEPVIPSYFPTMASVSPDHL